MAMHAQAFFLDHLRLPFTDAAVVGNTYYATPQPDSPLKLRISFARTITLGEYEGLRLAVLHEDRGELDAVTVLFEDHRTFDHRDAAQGRRPNETGYATISEFRDRPDWVPWQGAHINRLRDAIEQYASVWFPTARGTAAPTAAANRTARNTPAPPAKSASDTPRAASRSSAPLGPADRGRSPASATADPPDRTGPPPERTLTPIWLPRELLQVSPPYQDNDNRQLRTRTAAGVLDVVSLGESAMGDEGCGYADEGEEVFGLAFVAAVQTAAAGQPGDRSFDEDSVPLRAMRWRMRRSRSHFRRWS
ncbi:hypothetical protein GCM10010267_69160 [Streptomyces griseorubens]|nr:hypothetical protein GCM10010267_69160 [Streptomyces griseorubens]